MPYSFFLNYNAGGQANSYLNDIDDIDKAITEFVDVGLRSALAILMFGTAITIWNPYIGILSIVIFPVTIFAQRKIRKKVAQNSRSKTDLREEIVSQVSEAISTVSVVKSFGLEDMVEAQTEDASGRFKDNDVIMETYQSVMRSSASVLLIFVQYSFFAVGAVMVINGQLVISAFVGQIMFLGRLIGPLNSFLEYINTLNKSEAALHRVRETLALEREGEQHSRLIESIPSIESGVSIDINSLKFRHDEDIPLIEGWDLSIEAGQTVAIIGPSGCGKTTLFNLLLGLFDNYSGEIKFNGQNLQQTSLKAAREKTSVVFQEHILFNDSIRNNLLIGSSTDDSDSITDDDLWEVLEMAHAKEFVQNLTNGLDTMVGENGVKLSGGQRQRLSLARVIVKNSPLLLLDEATSALDSFSEVHIQKALNELFKDRTSLIIAHRLSTITHADKIIVIDKGKILQKGTHEQLLTEGGIYKKLYDAQVHGFVDWNSAIEEESAHA